MCGDANFLWEDPAFTAKDFDLYRAGSISKLVVRLQLGHTVGPRSARADLQLQRMSLKNRTGHQRDKHRDDTFVDLDAPFA
jgi:hypothetical protein